MRIGVAIALSFLSALLALQIAAPAADEAPAVAPDKAAVKAKTQIVAAKRIDDFTLRDFRGATVRLADFSDAKAVVVVFLGAECPLAKLYGARLTELAEQYKDKQIALLAIDSNVHDSISDVAAAARAWKATYPVLRDPGNRVADEFGATRTPEAFLLDADRTIRYHGRIDDQYGIGVQKNSAEKHYLVDAIDAVLAGREVVEPNVAAVGCLIGRAGEPKADGAVTYSNQIARIFQKRCVECHREGEIAPFALDSYDEAFGWSAMIAETVEQGRMPPWHANPAHGSFRNDARLSDEEKRQIARWAADGAPQGDPKELPKPREFVEGWGIGKPDLVYQITKKPFSVPATGEVKYQYFVVDPGFKEDAWIRAAECRPGNRQVVHHIVAFVKPPGGRDMKSGSSVQNDFLVATAPGTPPLKLPIGLAKLVPAGSVFVFQMHYTPNGSPQEDQSELGIVLADPKEVRKEVGTWRAINQWFKIPPGAANHEVEAWHRFREDTLLLAMFPHMHLRGKSFRYEAVYADGKREILLDVPRYDFNWQNSYILSVPKLMPRGSRLICTATFDNSADNPSNPDPTATVRWGDQTWEEMMIGYFAMMLPEQDLKKEREEAERKAKAESSADDAEKRR